MQGSIQAPAVLAFLWKAKWAILFLLLFVFGVGALRGCVPFDFAKSRDTLRAERNAERLNTEVAKHEADLGAFALDQSDKTHLRVQTSRDIARRGQQDIANAVEDLPPAIGPEHYADLDRLYCRTYERVLRTSGACEDRPDPAPSRSPPVRGARPDAA